MFDDFLSGEYDEQLDTLIGQFWGSPIVAEQGFMERQMKWVAKKAIKSFAGSIKDGVEGGSIQLNVNGKQYDPFAKQPTASGTDQAKIKGGRQTKIKKGRSSKNRNTKKSTRKNDEM